MKRLETTSSLLRRGLPCGAAALLAAALAVLPAGCGAGGSARVDGPALGAGPVRLNAARRQGAGREAEASVLRPLDEARVRRALEIYAINKKRTLGSYRAVGADLNEDGVPEVLVLFQGRDWCAKNGCSLAVLRADGHGYKPISRTVRVKPPVVISREQTNGWRDLFVSTGGSGSAPLRRVRLRFGTSSYSRNAMLEEELPPDVPQLGETAFALEEPATPVAGGRSAAR